MRAQLAAMDVDEMWKNSEIEDKLAALEDQDCKNKVSKMKEQWKASRLWVKKASEGKFKFPVRKMLDGNAAEELQNWITGF
eukprot:1799016-Rhodomonas_salina.1